MLLWPRLQTGATARARQPRLQTRARAAGPRAAVLLRPPAVSVRNGSPAPHATPVKEFDTDHAAGNPSISNQASAARCREAARCQVSMHVWLRPNTRKSFR